MVRCGKTHAVRTPEPPSRRVPSVPEDLERVILRCLEKKPSDRHASAASLEADLARCADAGKWTCREARAFWDATGAQPHSITRLAHR